MKAKDSRPSGTERFSNLHSRGSSTIEHKGEVHRYRSQGSLKNDELEAAILGIVGQYAREGDSLSLIILK